MSWLASFLAILLYLKRKVFGPKDSSPKKERKNIAIINHYKLLDRLEENMDQEIIIQLKNLNHLYENQLSNANHELRGKVVTMDDDWIKLELNTSNFPIDRWPDYLYFRTEIVVDFNRIN